MNSKLSRLSDSCGGGWPRLLTRAGLALWANAVKFHAVFSQFVSNRFLHATVQGILIRHRKIFESAAFDAAHVVVTLALGFVARRSIADFALQEQALIHKKLQVAVDCS
jgi:hypothetical protein